MMKLADAIGDNFLAASEKLDRVSARFRDQAT
jgi:hypothetical protein